MTRQWIFAYGSLMFRPGYDAHERRVATVQGYVRRFWQGSPDHRGTAAAPGRVVTLVPTTSVPDGDRDGLASVTGMASLVDVDDALLATLDHREQAGYQRLQLPMSLDDGRSVDGIVYVARLDNPHLLGPATPQAIAEHVARSRGPSGDNASYVLDLDATLATLGIKDPHVAAIAAVLRTLGSDR